MLGPGDAWRVMEERLDLDERSRAILEFERSWWQQPGSKEDAIRQHFRLSAARYYQLLSRLIDSPEALRHDPMLVKRLRRLRTARRRQRFVRGYGLGR
ncbi:MAG: DUF3263 domain-containing protein [Actinomycetota bacterium]|nr:DUF3263 domain-containing protein [Actinomycetota bacterium]